MILHFGRFGWHDLNTSDIDASAAFYAQLFGWTVDATPRPNNYRGLSNDSGEFGGLFPWPPEAAGMPTHWTGYVLVEDVVATAHRARELGGTIAFESMAIPGVGTLGVIFDPTGASVTTFAPVQISDAWPLGPGGTGGAVLWNELMTTELAASVTFHCQLFGWEVDQDVVDAGGYVIARRGPVAAAAIFSPSVAASVSAWITYFDTPNIFDTIARAESLGATVIHPVTEIPGIGRTAWVNDPQGAT
ncbi:MAG: VOC family protein, partial [Thermomicrobiales bacterium]